MDPLNKNMFEHMKRLSLSPEELTHSRQVLSSFMESHPAAVPSPFVVRTLAVFRRSSFVYAGIAAAFILLFGGLAAEANGALPGDLLYPVKTGLNERVQAVLAFTGKAKGLVEAKQAATRLEEAEKLDTQGRLTPQVKTELQSTFVSHAYQASSAKAGLYAEGKAADASAVDASIQSLFKEHGRILNVLAGQGNQKERGNGSGNGNAGNKKGGTEDGGKQGDQGNGRQDPIPALSAAVSASSSAGLVASTSEPAFETIGASADNHSSADAGKPLPDNGQQDSQHGQKDGSQGGGQSGKDGHSENILQLLDQGNQKKNEGRAQVRIGI